MLETIREYAVRNVLGQTYATVSRCTACAVHGRARTAGARLARPCSRRFRLHRAENATIMRAALGYALRSHRTTEDLVALLLRDQLLGSRAPSKVRFGEGRAVTCRMRSTQAVLTTSALRTRALRARREFLRRASGRPRGAARMLGEARAREIARERSLTRSTAGGALDPAGDLSSARRAASTSDRRHCSVEGARDLPRAREAIHGTSRQTLSALLGVAHDHARRPTHEAHSLLERALDAASASRRRHAAVCPRHCRESAEAVLASQGRHAEAAERDQREALLPST